MMSSRAFESAHAYPSCTISSSNRSADSPPPPPPLKNAYDDDSPPRSLINAYDEISTSDLYEPRLVLNSSSPPLINAYDEIQTSTPPLINAYDEIRTSDLHEPSLLLNLNSSPLINAYDEIQTRDVNEPSLVLINAYDEIQISDLHEPRLVLHSSSSPPPPPLINAYDEIRTSDLHELHSSSPSLINAYDEIRTSDLLKERLVLYSSSSEQNERYEIPKELEDQIKKDIVPIILRLPPSPSTYADYFATLLYAEDFYMEKWSKFLLFGVTVKLHCGELEISPENKTANRTVKKKKGPFVTFVIELIPEKQPYLLSRDFVFLKRCGMTAEPLKGILFRVEKSTTVLVEFKDDFHSQHSPSNKYDVSFSFNRVCLKRAHEAISAAKDHSLHDILFPKLSPNSSTSTSQSNVIHNDQGRHNITNRILNHKGRLPYLIEGQLKAILGIIQEAILKICSTSPNCRILVCADTNWSCDELMQSLLNKIPQAKLFRANAAFRDYDLVPDDIIQQSLYEGECFTCPSLYELQNFKVVTSTFVSSFRLHAKGIDANHFSHIFLMDASSAVEPEVVVPLAHFVGKNTVTIVTGSSGSYPIWVRSDIGRKHGLKKSYFQRLLEREPYSSRDPMYITNV